jgi:glycosyltransferase involved in cell wall biosynthesis
VRILHVLDFSLPQVQSGYSIRSKYIVDNQRDLGLVPAVATRDTVTVHDPVRPVLLEEELNGVRYYREPALALDSGVLERLQATPGFGKVYGRGLSRRFRKLVARAVRAHRPDVIHAASPDVIGLWASDIAREFGLPLVYEVRGLWHETSVALRRIEAGSPVYEKMSATFVEALKRADAIVTLSETVKAEIERSGISLDKVHLVPNGVDTDRFVPRDRPPDLARDLEIARDEVVIGYVGSLRSFEGLDLVLRAVRKLRDAGLPVKSVLAGAGESLDDLKALSSSLGLDGVVHFPGQVTHDRAPDYVSLMDIVTMPRTRSRVTELVTPLKPYEALAAGRALIVSDVGALCEIVSDGETGLVCRADDVGDLADKCELLVRDTGLRHDLGARGREWVASERTWRGLVGRYREIYRAAQENAGRPSVAVDEARPRQVVLLQPAGGPDSGLEKIADTLSTDGRVTLSQLSSAVEMDAARELIGQAVPDCLIIPSYPFDGCLVAEQVSQLVVAAREANPDVDVICLLHDGSAVRDDENQAHYDSVCPVLYALFDAILVTTEAENPVDRLPWATDIVVPVVRTEADKVGDVLAGM